MKTGRRRSPKLSSPRRAASNASSGGLRGNAAAATAGIRRGGGNGSLSRQPSRTSVSQHVKPDMRRSKKYSTAPGTGFETERQKRRGRKGHGANNRADSKRISSPGLRGRLEGSARSRCGSRAVLDIAVSRLQRWGRVVILQQYLRTPGMLKARISAILEVEYRLWRLRVRMAKRVLRQAFNNLASTRRDDPGTACQRMREQAVTVINAFIRAKSGDISTQRKRHVTLKRAVEVIEATWIKSSRYQKLKKISLEVRVQRLLMIRESIERRDYIRQRWVFLIECHQRCYNDPILLEAGIAVRKLEWWEHVVMDGNKDVMCTSRSSKEMSEKQEMIEKVENFSRGDANASTSSFVAYPSRVLPISDHNKQRILTGVSSEKLVECHTLDDGEELGDESPSEVSVDNRFYKRADAAFVFGILHEVGQLDFALSMGARPISLDLPLEFIDSLVSSTCLARLQETKNALKRIKSRFVRFGGAFLRESLQNLPLFREVNMQIHYRGAEVWHTQQQMFITSDDSDAVKTFFLQPRSRKQCETGVRSSLDYSLSAAVMGKGWVELYHTLVQLFDPVRGESNKTSRRNTDISSFSSTPQTTFYRRKVGQIHTRCGLRLTLQELTAPGMKTSGSKKSEQCASMLTRMSGIGSSTQPVKLFGSEYECIYEIERLLVREYNHRLKLENQYKTVITAFEWLFQSEHKLNSPSSNESDDKKDKSVVPFLKASPQYMSVAQFEMLRSLLMA